MYFRVMGNYLCECISNGDTEAIIPESVMQIGERAFLDNTTIESVKLHNRINTLEAQCFENCSALKEIDLPDSISVIKRRSFAECTSLERVRLPRYLEAVDDMTFMGCTALRVIEIPEGVKSINYHAFSECSSLERIHLPDSVISIDTSAFCDCTSLYEAILPSKLSRLEMDIFGGCINLQRVVLPQGIKVICSHAFENCRLLSDIELPEGIERIRAAAFSGCSSLKEIRLPFSLQEMDETSFPSETLLYYPYRGDDISDWTADKKFYALCGFIKHYAENDGFVSDEALLSYCNYIRRRRSVLLPKLAKFETAVLFLLKTGIYKLEEINALIEETESTELKASLLQYKQDHFTAGDEYALLKREMERDPFSAAEMKKLFSYAADSDRTITINDVKMVIPFLVIPSRIGRRKVTRIGDRACSYELENILMQENVSPQQVIIPDGITDIGKHAFAYCVQMKDINIPDSVQNIGEYAFCGCSVLENVHLSDSLTSVGNGCFDICEKLKRIVLPAKFQYISCRMFRKCSDLEEICINDGLMYILNYAFEDCSSLERITLPASVISVYDRAFAGCTNLKELIVEGSETEFLANAVPEECNMVTIYARKGSAAQRYAENNGINFSPTDG